MTWLTEVEGLSAADVMHNRISSLPATVTVGEVREYFAESASRQLALLVDGGRYVGSIAVADLRDDLDAADPAAGHAVRAPTIAPDASASQARDAALAHPSRRLPVVDEAGALLGIVAIDKREERFCGA